MTGLEGRAREVAKGLSWIESFTLRSVIGGPFCWRFMAFEMTANERGAVKTLTKMGLARKAFIGWVETDFGLAVRRILEETK